MMSNQNQEEKVNLNVIQIDESDVYGNYSDDELVFAMKDLYVLLKEDIDKNYTIEEQMEYHYEELNQLIDIMNNKDLDLTDINNFRKFLNIYNDISPNEYTVDQIEIDASEEAMVIRYICDYGLENYMEDFKQVHVEIRTLDKNHVRLRTIFKEEIEEFIFEELEREINFIKNNYTGSEILDFKYHYLEKLIDINMQLQNGIDKLVVLSRFREIFNEEYMNTSKKMTIS